ncbi:MAG: phage minor head protein [Paludibacteraceae bacterium]
MPTEWQADGDDYDLQYRTAGDERVRGAHAALDGVTLPPSDKFWNKYLPPNGWNCRCQVVQVLREDYPQTNSDQATEWGDACTADPKEKIFRFNAGKELKLFPPKHPYLPKGCGDCATKRNTLLLTRPDRALPQCQACGEIMKQCLSKQTKEIRSWAQDKIPEVKGIKIEGANFVSGAMDVTRKSVKSVLGHSLNMAVRNSLYGIQTGALRYKYIGWKETDDGKHADAAYFTYYEVEIAGHKYYANVIVSKSRKNEVLYCIYEKCDFARLRHDTPPDIE